MKLYLVTERYPCEDNTDILGIFSSKEEAEKYVDNRFICVYEFELDKTAYISV